MAEADTEPQGRLAGPGHAHACRCGCPPSIPVSQVPHHCWRYFLVGDFRPRTQHSNIIKYWVNASPLLTAAQAPQRLCPSLQCLRPLHRRRTWVVLTRPSRALVENVLDGYTRLPLAIWIPYGKKQRTDYMTDSAIRDLMTFDLDAITRYSCQHHGADQFLVIS